MGCVSDKPQKQARNDQMDTDIDFRLSLQNYASQIISQFYLIESQIQAFHLQTIEVNSLPIEYTKLDSRQFLEMLKSCPNIEQEQFEDSKEKLKEMYCRLSHLIQRATNLLFDSKYNKLIDKEQKNLLLQNILNNEKRSMKFFQYEQNLNSIMLKLQTESVHRRIQSQGESGVLKSFQTKESSLNLYKHQEKEEIQINKQLP
ncbi:hypothetical protein ABPG74_019352 [Tetrahymena malaccensis]